MDTSTTCRWYSLPAGEAPQLNAILMAHTAEDMPQPPEFPILAAEIRELALASPTITSKAA